MHAHVSILLTLCLCICVCVLQKRRAYWDGSSPASSSSHSSDPSQSASTSQHLPSPHDPLTPHTPLAPLTPPVIDYTEVFAFDQIALSSELEKTTTLEAFIPDEELSGYSLPKGPITPYRYGLSVCLVCLCIPCFFYSMQIFYAHSLVYTFKTHILILLHILPSSPLSSPPLLLL